MSLRAVSPLTPSGALPSVGRTAECRRHPWCTSGETPGVSNLTIESEIASLAKKLVRNGLCDLMTIDLSCLLDSIPTRFYHTNDIEKGL